MLQVQDELAAGTAGSADGRILIAGGSSGLFGMDGVTLSRLTGRPVHNLASHAGLSMDFHLDRVERLARAGDIVLVTPELRYFEEAGTSAFEQEQAAIWLSRDYAAQRPWDAFETAWRTPSDVLLTTAAARLRHGRQAESGRDPAGSMALWRQARDGDRARPHLPYAVEWLDESGGVLVPEAPVRGALRTREIRVRYGSAPDEVAPALMRRLKRASGRLATRGASLHLLLPPLMEGPEGRFNTIEDSPARLAANLAQLESAGVDVVCSLETALLAPERFYDTLYHLNAWGGAERAFRVAACLQAEGLIEAAAPPAVQPDGATPWPAVLEARADHAVLQDWETALLGLLRLQAALEAYRVEHGQYPESERWDGPNSNWGRSGEHWLEALIPAQIERLPRNLAGSSVGYLYWSNGADFKLIYQDGQVARQIAALAPDFLDPQREAAFGVWTDPRLDNW